jgi:hypothetical protein
MPHYRLYRLHVNNYIMQALDFDGADDEAAVDEAIRIDHAAIVEIWCGVRRVARVEPDTREVQPG